MGKGLQSSSNMCVATTCEFTEKDCGKPLIPSIRISSTQPLFKLGVSQHWVDMYMNGDLYVSGHRITK
jgi:hypothetical protein